MIGAGSHSLKFTLRHARDGIPLTTTAANMLEFFQDLWAFLRVRKKVWLLPIIVVLLALGGLVAVSQQSVLGAFIYTLF